MMNLSHLLHSIFILSFICNSRNVEGQNHNYDDALQKAIIFFEGQRSGKLPEQNDIHWRADSGVSDGERDGVDLTGGYYDAGDNVKFNFPMAYTITLLSWAGLEYGNKMESGTYNSLVEAIRWGTDYLLKCATAKPDILYVGVGDPNVDHACWQRPEDVEKTERNVYWVSGTKPGSDVAGETAAALAAASIVFRKADPGYSEKLSETAKKVMHFAVTHKGSYSDSLGNAVCPFYQSYSGYTDELLWGAAWLYRATNFDYYINFITNSGPCDTPNIFSWDNKYAGSYVLLARRYLVDGNSKFQQFSTQAEEFICKILYNTQYTPGGLMYELDGSNLEYVTSITSLLTTYAKYMAKSNHVFTCGDHSITSKILRSLAKKQVDYILGDNPMKMSYMVGYGSRYPKNIHHRGSSLPSIKDHPQLFTCNEGKDKYFYTSNPNPNILTGAIVGGPNRNDRFSDDRGDYSQSEPATYINAAIVGPLAYLVESWRGKESK